MHVIGRKNIKKRNVIECFKNISLKVILRIFFKKRIIILTVFCISHESDIKNF